LEKNHTKLFAEFEFFDGGMSLDICFCNFQSEQFFDGGVSLDICLCNFQSEP
jgi:hypothetical protein